MVAWGGAVGRPRPRGRGLYWLRGGRACRPAGRAHLSMQKGPWLCGRGEGGVGGGDGKGKRWWLWCGVDEHLRGWAAVGQPACIGWQGDGGTAGVFARPAHMLYQHGAAGGVTGQVAAGQCFSDRQRGPPASCVWAEAGSPHAAARSLPAARRVQPAKPAINPASTCHAAPQMDPRPISSKLSPGMLPQFRRLRCGAGGGGGMPCHRVLQARGYTNQGRHCMWFDANGIFHSVGMHATPKPAGGTSRPGWGSCLRQVLPPGRAAPPHWDEVRCSWCCPGASGQATGGCGAAPAPSTWAK